MLILVLLVIWLGTIGILAVSTIFFQSYVYTEPVRNLGWRAPAAGSVLGLFYVVWVFLHYASPGNYQALFDADWKVEIAPYPEYHIVNQEGKEEIYRKVKGAKGQEIYLRDGKPNGDQPPVRPQRVIVHDKDQELVFEPDRDAKGKFHAEPGQSLIYREKSTGLTMQEGAIGVAARYRTLALFGSVLFNLIHLAIWFAVLWLLLEYQWIHAFGLAIVFWLAATLFLLPPTLSRVDALPRPATVKS
jgi:hypothetical protein